MATKDHCLLKKADNIYCKPLADQYSNLNLNQNYQSLHTHNNENSKSAFNDNKKVEKYDFTGSTALQTIRDLNLISNAWRKSNKHLSIFNSNFESEQKDEYERVKNDNSSTLSLHIAAYENLIEASDDINEKESSKSKKRCDIGSSSSFFHNTYEFPRQQENQNKPPEAMHFKASQQLLNPNEENLNINPFFSSYLPSAMDRSEIKDREYLYKLVIGQLFYDGYRQVAANLAEEIGMVQEHAAPSDKLFRLFSIAKQFSDEPEKENGESLFKYNAESMGLDLEYDADVASTAPEPASYETVFLSNHKAPCRSATFNIDGSLAAIGSADCSIKIYDIEKIIAREVRGENITDDQVQPVIRTLYDHVDEVSCLAFHPREAILISGSHDKTVKFFDYSKMAVKRCMRSIRETEPVRAFAVHPGGEFLLVAVDHPTLRLYNIETQQCYVSSNPADQHERAVVDVCYADNAKLAVSGSLDGDVKIWDGISNRCVQTFTRAHDGIPIRSAKFTRNAKYVLTTGTDCSVKLWELSTNRCIVAYTGAGGSGYSDYSAPASFNHNEDYVLLPDDKSGSLCTWASRTGDRKRLLALGHTAPIRDFVHSKTSPAFITCSEDCKARFWYKKL